ncbi:aldo/keto reductase [Actinomadura scrupuli]|uniref:aldo/keto reductase n=1 Tax=Actinomadura scrupuli TaxID=559629 RepID=UPI003D9917AE
MEHRRLGDSGVVVSAYALGTMTFGGVTDEAESHRQLDRFVEAGGTLVDTADVYVGGESESIIGRWLAARPAEVTDRVILASKGRFPTSDDANGVGLSRRHLARALEASLRRLGVETIDLYQVHAWDPLTPLEETLSFLDDAVHAGKIGYIGLSNFTGWQLQRAVDLAAFTGRTRPVSLQPQYNLLSRELEWEIVPAAQANGLGLLPWSPLAGGLLTGKYARDERPASQTRFGDGTMPSQAMYEARSARQRTWDVIEAVTEVADGRGVSPAQVALAWVAARPGVASVILGARTLDQLEGNLAAAGLTLSTEETKRLDTASDPDPADYPYGTFGTFQRTRPVGGGRPSPPAR